MPPKYEVREVMKVFEKSGLEGKMPIYDSERMIMEKGHLALQDEIKCSTRKNLAPYGLEEVEFQHTEGGCSRDPLRFPDRIQGRESDDIFASISRNHWGTREAFLLRIGSKTRWRGTKKSRERERAWMKPSVKLEKKWI